MRARKIYQRLMRNRLQNFWGHRACLTIRIPLASLPPMPVFTPPGESDDECLGWVRTVNGVRERIFIEKFHTGVDPRLHWDGHYYCVDKESGSKPDDEWWETYEVKVRRGDIDAIDPEGVSDLDPVEAEPLATAYKALSDWRAKYLKPSRDTGIKALDALHEAASGAKTTYCFTHERYAYITYSVKSAYRTRVERVARDVARALQICNAEQFSVKIMRGVPSLLL